MNEGAGISQKRIWSATVCGSLAFALYVNNVSVSEPGEVKRVVGQALGEIAAAAYEAEESGPVR